MNPLIHLASFSHHSYSYGGYGYHHGSSGGWITHMVVSSVVHALIYTTIFHAMRGLSTGEILLIAIAVIAALYWWNRNRPRRW